MLHVNQIGETAYLPTQEAVRQSLPRLERHRPLQHFQNSTGSESGHRLSLRGEPVHGSAIMLVKRILEGICLSVSTHVPHIDDIYRHHADDAGCIEHGRRLSVSWEGCHHVRVCTVIQCTVRRWPVEGWGKHAMESTPVRHSLAITLD